jgi:hypothetical protein
MDEKGLRRVLEGGHLTAEDILRQTAADRIDEVLALLKHCRPAEEVCHALYQRIGGAPLDEFETLKAAYFKHCAN